MDYDEEALKTRAEQYEHKSKVLRQIQSSKLEKSVFWDNSLNYSTIIVSTAVTVLTFFGVKNLHNLFFHESISYEKMEFIFNILVFLLLIAAFLQMTLGLKEKSLSHLRAIRELTDFITTLDDIKLRKNILQPECERYLERLNNKYASINSSLPANSDIEWKKAKKQLSRKEDNT